MNFTSVSLSLSLSSAPPPHVFLLCWIKKSTRCFCEIKNKIKESVWKVSLKVTAVEEDRNNLSGQNAASVTSRYLSHRPSEGWAPNRTKSLYCWVTCKCPRLLCVSSSLQENVLFSETRLFNKQHLEENLCSDCLVKWRRKLVTLFCRWWDASLCFHVLSL